MADSTEEKNAKIAFMGTAKYRAALQRAALDRGVKVQGLLEAAVVAYLDRNPLHALLDQILASGHQPTIRRVGELLEAAAQAPSKGATGEARQKLFYKVGSKTKKKGDPERDE